MAACLRHWPFFRALFCSAYATGAHAVEDVSAVVEFRNGKSQATSTVTPEGCCADIYISMV